MKCLECGFENSDDAIFCEECGAKFPRKKECPDCHAVVASHAKFCRMCGRRFGGNAPAAPAAAAVAGEQVLSPMPGTIVKMNVKAGQAVKSGEVLAVLEAMKMENEIMAPHDATVAQVLADVGTKVDTGTPIIVLG